MNFLSWTLAITLLVVMALKSVSFYEASICRQKAWHKGVELSTRTLLKGTPLSETSLDFKCRMKVSIVNRQITWSRQPLLKKHGIYLPLEGRL